MFELLSVIIFVWLLVKVIGLSLRLTWGIAKILASILISLALPILFIILVFVGGIASIVPAAMIVIAAGIVRISV